MTPELLDYFLEQHYVMPKHIKNDIAYCEWALLQLAGALHHCSQQQQNNSATKEFKCFIATEIGDIETDYKHVLRLLSLSTRTFRKFLSDRGLFVRDDLNKCIIARELPQTGQLPTGALLPKPKHVKPRSSLQELLQKWNITNDSIPKNEFLRQLGLCRRREHDAVPRPQRAKRRRRCNYRVEPHLEQLPSKKCKYDNVIFLD
ncbi:uncharacterized protein LOC115623189 [Scaptodrosophila lebanonensis]|uniref:Uncharacterized protein LOC115623189 n=1 Tax=Drosophila lebanonensis TaxID=7225 RepID=A0A6J2TE60_DROLE|nr:uncharacterized protein LOC115623189 [Scaptodrosophila lebanonensis]